MPSFHGRRVDPQPSLTQKGKHGFGRDATHCGHDRSQCFDYTAIATATGRGPRSQRRSPQPYMKNAITKDTFIEADESNVHSAFDAATLFGTRGPGAGCYRRAWR